jgi:hypothetical protein
MGIAAMLIESYMLHTIMAIGNLVTISMPSQTGNVLFSTFNPASDQIKVDVVSRAFDERVLATQTLSISGDRLSSGRLSSHHW